MTPTLECVLDRELAEKIISRSAEIIPQDGVLFRQGEPADCLYFVNSGEATLTMQAGDKQVRIRAGKGSLLGIPAIVGDQPYSMTLKRVGTQRFSGSVRSYSTT